MIILSIFSTALGNVHVPKGQLPRQEQRQVFGLAQWIPKDKCCIMK